MTVHQDALAKAQEILSAKNTGPSGVLAYMWANSSRQTTVNEGNKGFVYQRPFLNKGLMSDIRPYYAVVETNRSGLTVVAPPGGTQDIIYTVDGDEAYAELAKPKNQMDLIRELTGVTVEDMTDELFVAHLIGSDRITNVHLEESFSAAARETEEEHGFDLDSAHGNSACKFETDETLFSKRSFQTNPPTPISQKLFVVEVGSFDDTTPRYTEKTETKIPSKMGDAFYEKGNFMDLREMEHALVVADAQLSKGDLSEVADHDYQAAKSRLEMMRRIEARIYSR